MQLQLPINFGHKLENWIVAAAYRILHLPVQAEADTYVMKLPDIDKFEEKLRKAEDELGIKLESRVPVTFERSK